MALSNRQRLRNLERQIISGKSPYIRNTLPGAAALLAKYKLDPESIFLPDPHKTPRKVILALKNMEEIAAELKERNQELTRR